VRSFFAVSHNGESPVTLTADLEILWMSGGCQMYGAPERTWCAI